MTLFFFKWILTRSRIWCQNDFCSAAREGMEMLALVKEKKESTTLEKCQHTCDISRIRWSRVNERNASIYSQLSQLNKAFGSIAGENLLRGTFTRILSLLVYVLVKSTVCLRDETATSAQSDTHTQPRQKMGLKRLLVQQTSALLTSPSWGKHTHITSLCLPFLSSCI